MTINVPLRITNARVLTNGEAQKLIADFISQRIDSTGVLTQLSRIEQSLRGVDVEIEAAERLNAKRDTQNETHEEVDVDITPGNVGVEPPIVEDIEDSSPVEEKPLGKQKKRKHHDAINGDGENVDREGTKDEKDKKERKRKRKSNASEN